MRKLAFILLLATTAHAQRLIQPKPHIVTVRPVASATSYTGVLWTWLPSSSGAAGYNLYQSVGLCPATGIPTGAVLIASGDTLTSFTQTPLPATQTCTYVTGISAAGVEGPASDTTFLDLTPPTAPGKPSATLK